MSPLEGPSDGRGRLISAAELLARLDDPNLRVIDARFELLDPPLGRALYAAGHVPGAVHLDLNLDLAGPPGAGRGRHPLPDMARFAARLGALGIGRGHDVVVYDQTGTMYAARAWWLLRYAGHERVRFLDGGLAEYLKAGGTVTTTVPRPEPTLFEVDLDPTMVASGSEVYERLGDPGLLLVDARAPERFRGEVEPIDATAGHIPGAVNVPFTDAIEDGRLLAPEALALRLGTARLAGTEIVAYCGSGVSAAHLVLAFEVAGLPGVRLYPGSWSEWSNHPDRPVATGAAAGRAAGQRGGHGGGTGADE